MRFTGFGILPEPVSEAETRNGNIDGITISAQLRSPFANPFEKRPGKRNKTVKSRIPDAKAQKPFFFN